ncbi:MAG: HU family DNA-binding protein [Prevotellaceae bacterium]|jgi:nucleoid DNA-binding protein|nr:HU family DNA-binding protein [Prevotellaceae bacterium]
MNHKELIADIAGKIDLTKTEVEHLLDIIVDVCCEQLEGRGSIGMQSFGVFDVKKREERLTVHPTTQKRMMIPPKLTVNFKQSSILKDKLKNVPS